MHPIRWAIALGLLIPLVLIVAGAAALTRNQELGHTLFRIARSVFIAEFLLLAIAATAGFLYQRGHVRQEEIEFHPPGQLVDVGGYNLHLYCTGSGSPTVVLEFGLDGSYLDWFFVQPKLAGFTRVCSYDRAGYGWSDSSPKPRLPSVMAEELRTLLLRAGEKPPFILVGHSFGAFDVLMFAKRYPDEVRGVVLVDGSHPDELFPFYLKKKIWIRFMQFTMPFGLPRWRKWCATGPADAGGVRQAIACRSKPFATHYEQWSAFQDAAEEVRRLGSLGDTPLVVISRDPDRAPDASDPIYGKREEHWKQLQLSLAKLSTDSVHLIAKGSGHSVPNDRPDIIVDALRQLAERLQSHVRTADQ